MASSAVSDVPVRPAATVVVLRADSAGLEILMVRRARSSAFMGNARVFPGGALDDVDHSDLARSAVAWDGDPAELPWRAAALRELAEEAGITITIPDGLGAQGVDAEVFASVLAAGGRFDAGRLVLMSNWITPYARGRVGHRFDTRFYAVEAPAAAEAIADDREVFEATWVTPRRALDLADRGEWVLEFPTSWHLRTLDGFAEPGEVVDHFRQEAGTEPVRPRVDFHDDGTFDVLLPGDEGYEAAQP